MRLWPECWWQATLSVVLHLYIMYYVYLFCTLCVVHIVYICCIILLHPRNEVQPRHSSRLHPVLHALLPAVLTGSWSELRKLLLLLLLLLPPIAIDPWSDQSCQKVRNSSSKLVQTKFPATLCYFQDCTHIYRRYPATLLLIMLIYETTETCWSMERILNPPCHYKFWLKIICTDAMGPDYNYNLLLFIIIITMITIKITCRDVATPAMEFRGRFWCSAVQKLRNRGWECEVT